MSLHHACHSVVTIGHTSRTHELPKISFIFVSRLGGEGLTLFNLFLKEIGRVEHFAKKAPFVGPLKQINVCALLFVPINKRPPVWRHKKIAMQDYGLRAGSQGQIG